MEDLKNMIVLKNLPSNIIEEAFVVVKSNIKININEKSKSDFKNENYVVAEAENVIKNYLSDIKKTENEKQINKMKIKYKRLKTFTIWIALVAILGGIINFI